MLDAGTASQSEVNAAAKKLSDAVNALKKQKPEAPVKIPEGVTVTHITCRPDRKYLERYRRSVLCAG